MGSRTTTEQKMPEFQETFLKETVIPYATDIAQREFTPYEGERVAGMTDLQQQALGGYGALSMGTPQFEQAGAAYGRLADYQMTPMQAATATAPSIYGGAEVERTTPFAGATVGPAATMQAAQLGPAATMQAAQLSPAERISGVGAVQAAQAPEQIAVDQLRTADMQSYMSPYTQGVIESSLRTLGGAQEQALDKLAAQAQAAKAFGGSRQGVAEAETRKAYGQQAADLVTKQMQQAFQQAQGAAQFDIGQTQAARTLASQQGMQAETLGQQAREAAAAREQAARAGNQQAANMFAQQQAQFEQQARQASMQAENATRQMQAQFAQQAGMAGMQAENAMRQMQAQFAQQAGMAGSAQDAARAAQQAGLTQAAGLAGMGAMNEAAQAQAAREQAARQSTFGGQFQAAGIQQAGAAGLTGLAGAQQQAQLAGLGAQMQAGEAARGLDQAALDAAYAEFARQQDFPLTGLNALATAASGIPSGYGTTTQSYGGLGPTLGAIGSLGMGLGPYGFNVLPR